MKQNTHTATRSLVAARLAKILLLAVLLQLAACSSIPMMSGGEGEQSEENVAETPAVASQTTNGEEQPSFSFDGPELNPYLEQSVDAPRAAQQLFDQAISAMSGQDWQEAELLLKQLTAEYPDLSGPFVNLGIVYRMTNRLDDAEGAFNGAIAANSLNLDAYNQLGFLKREEGDFSAAEASYLKALNTWPRHATSHKNIGILYDLYMGEWSKALDHFKRYKYLVGDDDKLIAGWVIDLERRIAAGQ